MKKSLVFTLFIAVLFVPFQTAIADVEPGLGGESPRWTIEDVFGTEDLPFAIGHRGYGENKIYSPDSPIENTTEAVRRAFREGAQMVEVDAVLTGDGIAVALHDDFLEDGTCVNSIDFKDLKDRLQDVSTLRHILQKARTFSTIEGSDRPGGQVLVEIKTPSPLCDPEDETIPALVDAVIGDIEHTKMKEQVIIESFSPEILLAVWGSEPDIPRMLAVSVLQLLPKDQLLQYGFTVTEIVKDVGFGLQWAEIGDPNYQGWVVYRLPGYVNVNQYVGVLLETGSRTASIDKDLLGLIESMGGSAAGFVAAIHFYGPNVLVYTIEDTGTVAEQIGQWYGIASFGADGIMVDNIPLGLDLEGLGAP